MGTNNTQFQDKILHCVDCDTDFIFRAGEQRYYLSKSLSQPKRCQDCRKKRKDSIVPDDGQGAR